jgi:hypothetical protein
MSLLLLCLFGLSIVLAIVFALTSPTPIWTRTMIAGTALAFGLVTYLSASSSPISPFSRSSNLSFGASEGLTAFIVVALIGAVTGVFGSYLYNLGDKAMRWRSIIRPLSATPLVIVPTVKLIESAGDPSPLAYILLFALCYQNGFFWERLLKE